MASCGTPKATPVIQRVVSGNTSIVTSSSKPINKSFASKDKILPKPTERNRTTTTVAAMKELKLTVETRQRTKTDPKLLLTPKAKENKPIPPGSVTKSGKKSAWNRKPKPAHSGVPVPEKMRKFLEDDSFINSLGEM